LRYDLAAVIGGRNSGQPAAVAREGWKEGSGTEEGEGMAVSWVATRARAPRRDDNGREADRTRLRRLDACLSLLEDANERGEDAVRGTAAQALRHHVPEIRDGMPISAAIDAVLRAQEPCLARGELRAAMTAGAATMTPVRSWAGPRPGIGEREGDGGFHPRVLSRRTEPSLPLLDERGARELTDRIRGDAGRLCMLLLEAHERRAWSALRYPTWELYVRREFALSRSRSYELLDQGKVVRAVEEAAGVSGIPDISAHAASQLKHHIAELAEDVRIRTRGLPADEVASVVSRAVCDARAGGHLRIASPQDPRQA
jgi:hypothetical protein